MNYSSSDYKGTSGISQEMLILNGDLKSGFNSGSRYVKNSPMKIDHVVRSPTRNIGNPIEMLEQVADETRKKPFTVPVVRVQLNSQPGLDNSNIKTRQSTISYQGYQYS